MREFKFRAYDEMNNILVYPDAIVSLRDGEMQLYFEEDNFLENIESKVTNKDSYEDMGDGYYLTTGFILMQYTETKDIKGKEIYERDIVRALHENYEVIWNDDRYYLYNKNIQYFYYREMHNEKIIIGNIYENPELLKEEK